MKSTNNQGRVLLGILVALMIGGMTAPAFADDHRGHDRGHHRDHHDNHRGGGYYPQQVYAPPAVYVTPQQSPGINLVIPLNFHR